MKAVMTGVYNMTHVDGIFTLTFGYVVEDGQGDQFSGYTSASSSEWDAKHPKWRERIAVAIKEAVAIHDPSVTADEVMFPDFVAVEV
jgi:hypothetical protein